MSTTRRDTQHQWKKDRSDNCRQAIEKILGKLEEIEDSIEIIAREIAKHQ